MAQTEGKNRRWIVYALYGALLTLILLYYRFPEDAFKDYLRETLTGIDSDLLVSFDRLSPSFPPGLIFLRPRISRRDSPDKVVFMADTLSVRPRLWSLIRMDPVFLFDSRTDDGNVSGHVNLKRKESGTLISASIDFKNIRLTDDLLIPEVLRRNLSGLLNGTLSYLGEGGFPARGTGEASMFLSGGALILPSPLLHLKVIDFDEVSLKLVLNNQRLILSNAHLRGKNLLGKASGSIFLREDLLSSRLDLKCEIEPLKGRDIIIISKSRKTCICVMH